MLSGTPRGVSAQKKFKWQKVSQHFSYPVLEQQNPLIKQIKAQAGLYKSQMQFPAGTAAQEKTSWNSNSTET